MTTTMIDTVVFRSYLNFSIPLLDHQPNPKASEIGDYTLEEPINHAWSKKEPDVPLTGD